MQEWNLTIGVEVLTSNMQLFDKLFLLEDNIFATKLIDSHEDNKIGINQRQN